MTSFHVNQEDTFNASLKIQNTRDNSMFFISTSLSNSVMDLKQEIENAKENLSAKNMTLIFSGHLLNDYFSLHHQGIKNGSTIYLLPKSVQKKENIKQLNESVEEAQPNEIQSSASLLHVFHVTRACVHKRRVKLFLNNPIIKLDQAFSSNSIYVFKGEILDKTKSFEYYNIANESTIVLIPIDYSNENPNVLDKWIKLTNDEEHFQSIIDSNTKKSCQIENSRLMDLKYNAIELKPKAFLSFYNEQIKRLNNI